MTRRLLTRLRVGASPHSGCRAGLYGTRLQHYDAAYSAAEYRVAQAIWLKHHLDRGGQHTRIWPATSVLHLTVHDGRITDQDSTAGPAVTAYLT